ncbi:restriction endonuclease subunit S [Thalassospira lucentensis]|uniref:restriction endonuclease subunit S n=1 Tax=Thalassospira lucentensis TaxID=168935 RepID=UPI0029420917|nr:restriction endonuclease subunit S [Thalassospira lucentensis]WOI12645.1 restriction endonuclease subunit S [Thalassospira lucentensis]
MSLSASNKSTWETKRLRFLARINKSRIPKELEETDEVSFIPMPAVGEYGGLELSETKPIGDIGAGYTPFVEDDVLVAKITPCFENGKGAVARGLINQAAYGTTELHVVSCGPELLPDFAFYLSISDPFRGFGEGSMYGAGGQKRVPESFIKDFLVSIPTLEHQKRILSFLETKLGEIDDLIAKKQEMLKLLAEKRSALITRAVTKGLNPDALMKSSGYDWLGDIPGHWEIKRLRFIGRPQNGINIGGEFFGKGHPFVSYSDVFNNFELPSNISGLVESSDDDRKRYSVQRGDIFFTRTSETIEEIGMSAVSMRTIPDATFAGFLIRVRPSRKVLLPSFAKYYFRNTSLRFFLVKEMNLVTRASLGQNLLGNLPVVIPSLAEQEQIVGFIETEATTLDAVTSTIESAILHLIEYRSSVISKAVTGELEVA